MSKFVETPETLEQLKARIADNPFVKVGIGIIQPDGGTRKHKGPANDGSFYPHTMAKGRYERMQNRYLCPVSSPSGFAGASAAVVQVAAPTLLWIVDWTYCKLGKPPEAPDPTLTDTDWILLDEVMETVQLALAPNGTDVLYRLTGTYVFANINPASDLLTEVRFPRPPWMPVDNGMVMNPQAYAKGMLDDEA